MAAETSDSQLGVSWHDSAWIPILNPGNVLEYFSQRTNPFYDRTCNNEVVRMQRLDPSNLKNMTGIEYEVIHVQDPILFVIRKQHRHSPSQATPIADYYILAGIVYQAPDLCSVINSRLLSALHNFQSAFDEAMSYSRYHPSKGYWWQFKDNHKKDGSGKSHKSEKAKKEDPSSSFQREGVNLLLGELTRKFPPNFIEHGAQTVATGQTKKKSEEDESESAGAKELTQPQGAGSTVTNGTQGGGGASAQSQGPASRGSSGVGQQSVKRTIGSEGTTKQPPSKRKKN